MSEVPSNELEDSALNNIQTVTASQPYMVEVTVDEKRLVMEVDTSVTVSLVSEQTFRELFFQIGRWTRTLSG